MVSYRYISLPLLAPRARSAAEEGAAPRLHIIDARPGALTTSVRRSAMRRRGAVGVGVAAQEGVQHILMSGQLDPGVMCGSALGVRWCSRRTSSDWRLSTDSARRFPP